MSPKSVIDMLHREIRGLHEAAYLLAFFTLGSQIFALFRDRLLAHQFGAGETLDIFYAAFRIPDTMYALVASMVSLFVLIPFMESASTKGKEELRSFLSNIFSFFSIVLLTFGGMAFLLAPQIVEFFYKGFSIAVQADMVPVVRILLLQPFFLGISNLFAAYVQIRGRFIIYAIAPILYNIGIIIGVIFFAPIFGVKGLAMGVVLGAVLHLGVQTPFIILNRMTPKFVIPNWKKVFEVVLVSMPRTVTLSSQQIVMLVMISLVSFYAEGSVSSFSFAWNLQAVPLAIIGSSYSVAAFPKLARLFGRKEFGEYKKLILVASRQIIFWSLPAVVFIIVLRAQIVRVVLGTGKFDWNATRMTAAILAILVISLLAQGLIVLLVRACYAAGKTMVPLVINITSSLFTVSMSFFMLFLVRRGVFGLCMLEKIMRVDNIQNISGEVLLIALVYSMGAILNATLLLIYFEKKYKHFMKGIFTTLWQSLLSSLIAGFGVYLVLNLTAEFLSKETFFGVLAHGAVAGFIGVCVWAVALIAFGNKDIVAAWMAFHEKFFKDEAHEVIGSIEGR